jgi:Flp pilus assembly protein TadD/4-amino-4-deoxy-L-arabinose transferase-like glycosyltransferase
VLALILRLAYLIESTTNPTFFEPIMDASDYDDLARRILDGQPALTPLFWQPAFYPLFLAGTYALTNSSILAAKLIQMALGALTCVLTYRLGAKLFDHRVGVLGGVLTCFCGPLFFYEGELLATGWAAFWSVMLVSSLIRVAESRGWVAALGLGLVGALSVVTRPTFLPVWLAGCAWILIVAIRSRQSWRVIARTVGCVAAGFVLVAVPVGLLNHSAQDGHFGILPASGGINLYIGNNPDAEETYLYRPGPDWTAMMARPEQAGHTEGMWDEQEYFYDEAFAYIRGHPGDFLRGLVYKSIQFFSARELPRSVDVYSFRPWSWMLSGLVWKAGGWGFPFGLLFPLAVVGMIHSARRIPAPVWLLMVLYSLAVILVFPAARYRVPLLPIVCLLAAAGCFGLLTAARAPGRLRLTGYVVLAVGVAVLISLPGPFPAESVNCAKEIHQFLGNRFSTNGRPDEAIGAYREALVYAPRDPDIHAKLAEALINEGDVDGAIHHYGESLQSRPDSALNHACLGVALGQKGDFPRAIHHYRRAIELDPQFAKVYVNLGAALEQTGQVDEAITAYRTSIGLDPGEPAVHYNLGLALASRGDTRDAIRSFQRSLELDPGNADAWYKMGISYFDLGDYARADASFRKVLDLRPGDPQAAEMRRRISR